MQKKEEKEKSEMENRFSEREWRAHIVRAHN